MTAPKKIKALSLLGILALAIGAFALIVPTHAHASGVPYAIGDVFVGVGGGKINHYDSSGNLKDTLDTSAGCNEDLGMAFDPTGNLYATASFGSCFPGGHVVKFDNMGNLLGPFGSGYSDSTESIVIDSSNNVYVGQPDGTKALKKFDSAGNFLQDYFPAVENRGTDWNDLAADQCTMFYTSEGSSVKRFNTCTNTQEPDFAAQSLPGRMTGGGTIGNTGTRHGFELHCNITQSPNNLEVNWGKGNKFHLDTLTAAICSDDPNISPNPPAAGFNTYKGKGTGTYNGVAGATAEWTFTDAGEPGTNDTATIKITDVNNNVVLNVSGKLSSGNQQAHNP